MVQAAAPLRTFGDPPPSAFAVVMATGIVSIATGQHGHPVAAGALLALAASALAVCWLLSGWRLVRRPGAVVSDLQSHARAPGFFTAVAGTAVVGGGCVTLSHAWPVAAALLALSVVAWLVLTYAVFAGLAIARDKPQLAGGIDGSWLLAVVATQSLAVLAASLSTGVPQPARMHLNFLALCAWLVGGMLYTWFMTLIVYRLLFFRFEPRDLTGPWWINMGAMAISALAGAQLATDVPGAPMLDGMQAFVRGGTVLYWATGTWWLPLLVILTAWRHLVRREPFRYHFSQWSAVFPLGMYSVATGKVATALALPFLQGVSDAFFWAAAVAWLAAAAGFVRALRRPAA